MDILHRDTVTLFSLYEKSRLDPMWYATVLHNVRIEMDKSAIIAKYGADTADNAVLHIPYTLRDLAEGEPQAKQIPWLKGKALVIEDKIWLPANEWDDQVNDDLPNTITFEAGDKFDFFWFGEWTGEQIISDSDYGVDEGFYGYMNRTQDYVFAITAVGGPYTLIPHFEIMAK